VNRHSEIILSVDQYGQVDETFYKAMAAGVVHSIMEQTTEPWGQRVCSVENTEGNLIEIGSFGK
jgi:uncharacterized glyoxalase superfamily protein PhnB